MHATIKLALAALCAGLSLACAAQDYAYETKDWGIKSTTSPKRSGFHAPTPLEVPGARTVRTLELKEMLAKDPALPLIDVLGQKTSLKGALGMTGAGEGALLGLQKENFAKVLEALTGGDKNRPLVFFCLSAECWLSYNTSLHA
ncbi:MAG: hypothetical protein ABIT82_12895, partial [Ramlibacter sp.]